MALGRSRVQARFEDPRVLLGDRLRGLYGLLLYSFTKTTFPKTFFFNRRSDGICFRTVWHPITSRPGGAYLSPCSGTTTCRWFWRGRTPPMLCVVSGSARRRSGRNQRFCRRGSSWRNVLLRNYSSWRVYDWSVTQSVGITPPMRCVTGFQSCLRLLVIGVVRRGWSLSTVGGCRNLVGITCI